MTNAKTDTEPSGEAIDENISDGFTDRDNVEEDDDDEAVVEINIRLLMPTTVCRFLLTRL
jgi:hypothetical protein